MQIRYYALAALLGMSGLAQATSFVATSDMLTNATEGTSDATSSSFKDDKIVLQARDDAASFVASQGQIRGAHLEAALRHMRANYSVGQADDQQLAQAILAL
ncbi:MAG TPA: DUF2388 domain-containing protein [Pseudomonas sp.]|nr:DUF2388 domain-containing protein [Pseudomonas sp.]